jgi:hypothetical protein
MVRRAVTGQQEAPAATGTNGFAWEPAVAPAPVRNGAVPATEPASALGTSVRWKKPAEPASGLLGGGIPADVPDFATVYKGAGVQPPEHGYGVDRVGQMLNHKSLAGLDRSVKASAVLAALDAAGVRIQEAVHDAYLRYKALLAFEAAKDFELTGIGPRNEHRIADLEKEIEAYQERRNDEIEALIRETNQAIAGLTRLKTRTRAEQERFHRAIALFVEPLPARVIPMTPKATLDESVASALKTDASPAAPDLKLVPPAQPAAAPAVPAEPEVGEGGAPEAPQSQAQDAQAEAAAKPPEPENE